MAKKQKAIKARLRIQIPAGAASPAPPVGPILGQYGVNMMEFCKEFNTRTQELSGNKVTVVLTIFEDKSYEFTTKTPVTADLIKKALNIKSGSGVPNKQKVGKLTKAQIEDIAKAKMIDLNTNDLQQASKIIAGSARAMGVEVQK